jgi:LAS superfamily LD-carboxypeptidase LdcB
VTPLELTGRATTHVEAFETARGDRFVAHPEAAAAFLRMSAAAAAEGFDLQPVSVHRTFAGQCAIWNPKWRGERTLYDRQGGVLVAAQIEPARRVETILWWSAIPGGSRHHWGTEFDVIDRTALPPDYKLRLMPDEFGPTGVFAELGLWLDARAGDFGFFRPYDRDRGGPQPEPWHLSYAPVSVPALQAFDLATLREAVEAGEVEGRAEILDALDAVYPRFVLNVGRFNPAHGLRS